MNSLLAPVSTQLLEELLKEWRWLLVDDYQIVGMTVMGDWLLLRDSEVFRLDIIEGTVSRVADNIQHLMVLCKSASTRDEIFLEGLAISVLEGHKLPPKLLCRISSSACAGRRVRRIQP